MTSSDMTTSSNVPLGEYFLQTEEGEDDGMRRPYHRTNLNSFQSLDDNDDGGCVAVMLRPFRALQRWHLIKLQHSKAYRNFVFMCQVILVFVKVGWAFYLTYQASLALDRVNAVEASLARAHQNINNVEQHVGSASKNISLLGDRVKKEVVRFGVELDTVSGNISEMHAATHDAFVQIHSVETNLSSLNIRDLIQNVSSLRNRLVDIRNQAVRELTNVSSQVANLSSLTVRLNDTLTNTAVQTVVILERLDHGELDAIYEQANQAKANLSALNSSISRQLLQHATQYNVTLTAAADRGVQAMNAQFTDMRRHLATDKATLSSMNASAHAVLVQSFQQARAAFASDAANLQAELDTSVAEMRRANASAQAALVQSFQQARAAFASDAEAIRALNASSWQSIDSAAQDVTQLLSSKVQDVLLFPAQLQAMNTTLYETVPAQLQAINVSLQEGLGDARTGLATVTASTTSLSSTLNTVSSTLNTASTKLDNLYKWSHTDNFGATPAFKNIFSCFQTLHGTEYYKCSNFVIN